MRPPAPLAGRVTERLAHAARSVASSRSGRSDRSRRTGRPRVVVSIYDDLGNPHYGGGGAVVAAELASRLAADYDVTLLAGSYTGCRRGRRGGRRDGVRIRYLPVGWAGARGGQLAFHALLPVAGVLLRHDVWLDSFTPPFSTSLLPLVTRRPVVGVVQMLSGEDMRARYRFPFDRVERRGLRWYRRLVVLNDADGRVVSRHSPRAQVSVVPNGVTLPPVEDVRPGTGGHILFLGRVDVRQKGLDLLLEAHARAGAGLPLVVAGSGPDREMELLRDLAAGRDDVELVGHVSGDRKAELLRDCALLAMPSRFETYGLCAIEAMSYGKPVLHFDLPRLGWIPESCGVRVPAEDTGALADALAALVADPAGRAALGRAGRAHAEDHDWDAMASQYRRVVDGVLAGG